jgi:hypothetical protein
MPIQPIECRCQSSADGHRSISVPIHWPDWVRIDLSVHQPKRSHHIVPSSALGVFWRVHRFASTSLCTKQEASAFRSVPTRSSLRVDIALHQGPCLKFNGAICTRTSENQDLSQSNSWAVRQRVGVRLRWCYWQMAKKRPNEIDRLLRHSALQEPFIMNPTWIAFSCTYKPASHIMQWRGLTRRLHKCCVV